MQTDLANMLEHYKVAQAFGDWMVSKKLTAVEDLGVLASSEDRLEDKVIPVLVAAKVIADDPGEIIPIKKAWAAARALQERNRNAVAGNINVAIDAPLDDTTKKTIDKLWREKHPFTLPIGHIFSDSLVGRLHRELSLTPPKLSQFHMEQLRLTSKPSAPTKSPITWGNDGRPYVDNEAVDVVKGYLEFLARSRAFFSTISMVTIQHPAWFSYADVLFVTYKIQEFLSMEWGNARAPMAHFLTAWAASMHCWSNKLRTNSKTLSETIRATAGWASHWTSYSPAGQGASAPAASSSGRAPDVQDQVEKFKRQAQKFQSERDELESRLKRRNEGNQHNQHNRSQRSRSVKRDRGGKGKGKGKGNRRY